MSSVDSTITKALDASTLRLSKLLKDLRKPGEFGVPANPTNIGGYGDEQWAGPNLSNRDWKKLGPAPSRKPNQSFGQHQDATNKWRMKQQGMEQANNEAYGNTVNRLGNNRKLRKDGAGPGLSSSSPNGGVMTGDMVHTNTAGRGGFKEPKRRALAARRS